MNWDFKNESSANRVLSDSDKSRIVNAITKAEITSSGEIRVFIEMDCPLEGPIQRAEEVFQQLEMGKTELKNGVLIYLALRSKKVAIVGDEGINRLAGGKYFWEKELKRLLVYLKRRELIEGLEYTIATIGYSLSEYFPYQPGQDVNELPDEVVFDLSKNK